MVKPEQNKAATEAADKSNIESSVESSIESSIESGKARYRSQWWEYIVGETRILPPGFTARRIAEVKTALKDDETFWFQVLDRTNAARHTPENLKKSFANEAEAAFVLNQMRGNFWAMIRREHTTRKKAQAQAKTRKKPEKKIKENVKVA